MDVLAIIHGESVRSGVFGDVVRSRGHALEEWSLAWGTPLPRPLDSYGAVLVFGGAMHADQDSITPGCGRRTSSCNGYSTCTCLSSESASARNCSRRRRMRGPPRRRGRGRLVRGRAHRCGRGRSTPRPHAADVRRVPVALLRPRRAGGRDRVGEEQAVHAGVPTRRERLGCPVPPRGDAPAGAELGRRGRDRRSTPRNCSPKRATASNRGTRWAVISATASSTQPSESALPPRGGVVQRFSTGARRGATL